MSIKYKTLLVGLLSVLSIIGITILLFYFSYFGYIDKDHEESVKREFEVTDYIVKKEEDNMKRVIIDWGQWDNTNNFISDQNQEYIDSNLQPDMIANLNLKSIIYLDKNKNIVYSGEVDASKEISQAFVDKLLKNEKNFDNTNVDGNVGLLSLKGNVYIVGILPTTSSDRKAESNGFLVMIREIDENLINYMEQISPMEVAFKEDQEDAYIHSNASYINLENSVIFYNKKYSEAYKMEADIIGQNSIEIEIVDKDYSSEQGIHFFSNFIIQFLGLIAVIIILDAVIINRYLLKRLLKVINFIEKVGETKDTSLTIDISGKDEIKKLADETNKMLSAISSAKEEVLFLSYYDRLTKFNNRTYMEKVFNDLDNNKEEWYFIAIGDVNGLKLINDAMGRSEGDKLLCIIAKILKETCGEDDYIFRWGGDEFAILIKNKDLSYVSNLIDEIKNKCIDELEFYFKISIAWGYAGNYEENSSSEAVMSLAEKRMYRNKLMEDKSARSATINSLLKTLHEKHSETEEHTLRIKNLSLKLGEKIGLATEKLDELELLSSLHDIGKIGISEHILMKPGKLTDEEWLIMKTHSEIGYRIASSTPELAHIADEILAHHERYDGTGYPNRLKGEQIPLLARIINIVDSFDVMTHKRVYKEAFDKEYVIEELKRCSGTQFDPFLVKEFIALLEEEHIY